VTLGQVRESVPQLMRRHATVSRPCQCGEPVVADSLLASDVWLAVRRHNVGRSHQAFSGAGGCRRTM